MNEQELIDAARANIEEGGAGWGVRVQLEIDEVFVGVYRGSELSEGGDYGDQTLYLFTGRDGIDCYMRGHSALVRKMEALAPSVGDKVVVVRGPDYTTANGTGYAYGVSKGEADEAPPGDDDIDW